MNLTLRQRDWALAAAAVCALEAGIEIVRLVAGGAIHGFGIGASIVLSLIFAAWQASAAVGLALRHRWGWVAGAWGAILSMGYGAVVELGGTPAGFGYLLGGVVILSGIVKSLPLFRIAPAHA